LNCLWQVHLVLGRLADGRNMQAFRDFAQGVRLAFENTLNAVS
jgi:hypothetical protein